jgi:hypothetical protein
VITIVMRKYSEKVKRVIFMCVKSWSMIEEITQKVFVEVYEQIEDLISEDISLRIYSIVFRQLNVTKKAESYRINGKSCFSDRKQ